MENALNKLIDICCYISCFCCDNTDFCTDYEELKLVDSETGKVVILKTPRN